MHTKLGTVGIALAGSGSRGVIMAGALKAITDLGITPDKVFTSSSGTLNGLIYVTGDMDKLEHIWLNIHTKDVYKKNPCSFSRALTSASSIYDSKPLYKTLQKYVDIQGIRNSKIELYINTTNLTDFSEWTLEAKELKDEEIIPFAFASASPPVFFPPVEFRGKLLTDSGVVNNYSILTALKAGCDTIICICPSIMEPRLPHNLLDMVKIVSSLSMQIDLPKEVRAITKVNDIIDKANDTLPPELDLKKINLIMIAPDKPLDIDFLDFEYSGYNRKDLINYGYNLAISKLKDLI